MTAAVPDWNIERALVWACRDQKAHLEAVIEKRHRDGLRDVRDLGVRVDGSAGAFEPHEDAVRLVTMCRAVEYGWLLIQYADGAAVPEWCARPLRCVPVMVGERLSKARGPNGPFCEVTYHGSADETRLRRAEWSRWYGGMVVLERRAEPLTWSAFRLVPWRGEAQPWLRDRKGPAPSSMRQDVIEGVRAGLSQGQIAARVGATVDQVKGHMRRARAAGLLSLKDGA